MTDSCLTVRFCLFTFVDWIIKHRKTSIKMCDDIEKCCRLCLDVESSHVSIFGEPTISVHMRACLGVNVFPSDPLPTDICMSCVSQLSQFYHFQINARCSQDWLASAIQARSKKAEKPTTHTVHPLPDSEYNSDSLLEFLNNTANIEEYLTNLGKEDIPAIVNMLDKNEQAIEGKLTSVKTAKQQSPKKKNGQVAMEIDVLDSDVEIVKEIILKEGPKKPQIKLDKNTFLCYGCKLKFDNLQKFSQHISVCETASRTCVQCDILFDSRLQMIEHSVSHNAPLTCNCGERFLTKERLINHQKVCRADYGVTLGLMYRCKECRDTFKDRFQLYRHARMHILKTEEKNCDICGCYFIGNDALIKHKKRDHESSENNMFR